MLTYITHYEKPSNIGSYAHCRILPVIYV